MLTLEGPAVQVYMGDYKATSPFAVIIDCNSPDFNGVDGILGFGLQVAYLQTIRGKRFEFAWLSVSLELE